MALQDLLTRSTLCNVEQKNGSTPGPAAAARPHRPAPRSDCQNVSRELFGMTSSDTSSDVSELQSQPTQQAEPEEHAKRTVTTAVSKPTVASQPADTADESGGRSRRQHSMVFPADLASCRNSIIAVDSETGELVAVLARNVHLEAGRHRHHSALPIDHSIPTPIDDKASVLRPFTAYIDPDDERNRPTSRRASVLRDDTFAPPPIPEKHCSTAAANFTVDAQSGRTAVKDSANAVVTINGLVRLIGRTAGLETHRPDLLREAHRRDASAGSDASGSTVGGPIVQLWRRVRRQTTRPVEHGAGPYDVTEVGAEARGNGDHVVTDNETDRAAVPTLDLDELSSSPEEMAPVSIADSVLVRLRRESLQSDELRAAEDRVWAEAIADESLPLEAASTFTEANKSTSREKEPCAVSSPDLRHGALPGGTVLRSFLSGDTVEPPIAPALSATEPMTSEANIFDKAIALISQQLLQLSLRRDVIPLQVSFSTLPGVVLLQNAAAVIPEHFSNSVSAGSDALSAISTGVWSTLSLLLFGAPQAESDVCPDSIERADEVDADGEFFIPPFDKDSWGKTPRPVYRRRRPTPSFANGFHLQARRYSLLHVDAHAIPRDVMIA